MLSFNSKISSYLRLTMLHSFNRYMKPAMFIHDKSVSSVKRVISDQYIRRCRLRSYQVWRRCGSGLWRAARGWDGCRQPSPPRSRSSAAALWSPQSQPELTLQEKSEAFNAYKKKNTSNIATRHMSVTEFSKPICGWNNMPIPQMCCDLTLDDNIRLGDGGETSVQRVDLSGGKKSLKDETEI